MRVMLDGVFFFSPCGEFLQPGFKNKKGWRIQQMAFGGNFFIKKIAISKEKKIRSRQI
jgi:hypothetical protein